MGVPGVVLSGVPRIGVGAAEATLDQGPWSRAATADTRQITGRVSRCSLVDLDMVMDGESHGESRENVSAILAAEPVVPFGKAKAGGAEDLIVVGNEW